MADFRHNQRLFDRTPALTVRALLLAVGAIVLMVLDQHQGHLNTVRHALSAMVYPVQAAVNAPFAASRWLSTTLASRNALLDENARLKRQNLEAAVHLQQLASLQRENDRLRALMDATQRVEGRILVAELVAVDLDPFRHHVVINKGTQDGAYDGQPLLDADGIMGQITHAGQYSSQVILITDPNHAIPVEINRNGLRTIAVGTGDIGALDLPYLPNNADVQEGDLLVSSGLGGRFPRGYPVAVVSSVGRDPGRPFATVSAQPSAALNRSHEVLLVWPAADTPPAHGTASEEGHR